MNKYNSIFYIKCSVSVKGLCVLLNFIRIQQSAQKTNM